LGVKLGVGVRNIGIMRLYVMGKILLTWGVGLLLLFSGLKAQVDPLHQLSRELDRRDGHTILLFGALESLNISFLEWAEDSSREVASPFDIPNIQVRMEPNWEAMSPLIRQDLRDKWKHHQRVASQLEGTYSLLQSHVAQNNFRGDRGAYLIGSLRRLLVMLEDLRTLQSEMYFLMRQGFRRKLPPPRDPVARAATLMLDSLVNISRDMLISMRFGPYSRINQRADSLLALSRRARILQATLKQPPYKRPESSTDAFRQYAWVLKQAVALEQAVRTYGPNMALPQRYRRHGRPYFLFNHQLNLRFSAEGEGLIAAFNRWCALADPLFLPHIREIPWLMPLDPPVERPPVPTQLAGAIPQNLVFLIDVSASMNEEGRLPLFQKAFTEMSEELREDDRIALVSFAGEAKEVLAPTPGSLRKTILEALRGMEGKGKTEIMSGFMAAYEAAGKYAGEGINSRVVLVTDGEFSIKRELVDLISNSLDNQISLTILYMGEMNEEMKARMYRLATIGGGRYHRLNRRDARARLVQAVLTPAFTP